MIINNITINIEKELENKWLAWMLEEIIPELLNSSSITGNSNLKLLSEVEGAGATYTFQFHYPSLADYHQSDVSPATLLYSLHHKLYRDKFVLFETLLEQL
jgi:hypothetical protein